ncbi:MAG TPA: HAD family hydrolase [Candidatus Nanoarchaeia archaeon]|nr:HAD family hydrolase [Candidatus Nanoarchaeia archaeon]
MGIELVVLDWDGTVTKVDEEAGPAVDGWREDVGVELKLSTFEIERRWSAAQATIEAHPGKYGWYFGKEKRIVAPAYADPLIMARTITELLFDEAGVLMNREEREEILQNRFFLGNYPKMLTVFKEDADTFLTELRARYDVVIVTNSGTEGVAKKVAQLPTDHSALRIHGDAKKYVLDLEWKDVPESVERAGYGRPLFLQRKQYNDVLLRLMGERGLNPRQVAVVGDIYELDLLVPEHLGMNIVLTPRASTPQFEVNAVRTSSFGYVTQTLREALPHLESCR